MPALLCYARGHLSIAERLQVLAVLQRSSGQRLERFVALQGPKLLIQWVLMHVPWGKAWSVKGQLYTWGKGPATGFDVEDVITTPRMAWAHEKTTKAQRQSRDASWWPSRHGAGAGAQVRPRVGAGSGVQVKGSKLDLTDRSDRSDLMLPPKRLQHPFGSFFGSNWIQHRWHPEIGGNRLCCGSSSSAVLTGVADALRGWLGGADLYSPVKSSDHCSHWFK
eukprot:Skav232138  [mRNA]  locus=scaffold1744:205182:213368:- [translate_table: standard]